MSEEDTSGDSPDVGERASDSVTKQLEERIYRDFDPGASLPSEGKLAVELGVSRLTVREAIRSLQARGLVGVSQGRRPVVLGLTSAPVGDFFTSAVRRDPRRLLDLLEVRRALEVHAAGLAAARAGTANLSASDRSALAALASSLEDMRESSSDADDFNRADLQFHESLAASTRNQMLVLLIEALAVPLYESRRYSWAGHIAKGLDVGEVVDQHKGIYEAVVNGDVRQAKSKMQAHLVATERDLRAGLRMRDQQ
jgi:GntR family transcriptional repressor for pyruvate dehydrogenase complex